MVSFPPSQIYNILNQEKEVLEQMAHILTEEAERLDLPFQFIPVVSKLENLDFEKLPVKTGEALAVCSIMHLHTLLACDQSDLDHSSVDDFIGTIWDQKFPQQWRAQALHGHQ
ncbi:scarecrow-like 3 [Perilla frutescens var. hirtella]|uniref:Scarecrow-like 3 n=1 Tax=Perilla frutescens var. hirtella TaxID=608512 RepID=A0AAD4JI42_PERFH|nr:scarecrow-like 3 [Perilla frutescens var. hirtella]